MFGFGEPSACNYRPTRYATYALDYQIGGLDPFVLHVSNLIYHLLTVLTVFFVLRRWAFAGAAVLMTAVWALHPVHADAVAYISGRRDVVSTLFFVAAFLWFIPRKGANLGAFWIAKLSVFRRVLRIWLYFLVRIVPGILLFFLAVRAKEMAVTLPAIVLWAVICKYWGQLGGLKAHLKRRWPIYALLLIGGVVFVVYRGFLSPATNMTGKWWGGSPVSNFATVFVLFGNYLWLIIWPARLVGDYFPHTITLARDFGDWRTLLGIGLYLVFLLLIFISLKRGWRATAFGLGWFLITLLPVSHIIPHHEIFAEHYLYLPLIGLVIALLPIAESLLSKGRLSKVLVVAVVGSICLASTMRTHSRSAEYQTQLGFYETAHHYAPNNARILYNLGLTYLNMDNCETALEYMLGAARYLRRESALGQHNVAAFLNCAERMGRSDIVDALVAALLARFPNEPIGHAWQGRRMLEVGRLQEAAIALGRAIALERGRDGDAVAMLALAHNEAGHHQEALNALNMFPHQLQVHCEQEVRALMGLGVEHYSDAYFRVEDCLESWPDSLLLLEFRAGLYFSLGQREQAEADLERLEELGASEETLERVRAWRDLR